MSKKFNLNLNWYFKPSFDVTDINNTSVEGFEKINLPHTVKELSYNCFSHGLHLHAQADNSAGVRRQARHSGV